MVRLTFDASMMTSEFRIGDWVRLARIPPQVERGEPQFPETHAIFQKSLGGLFRFAALTSMATRNSGCGRMAPKTGEEAHTALGWSPNTLWGPADSHESGTALKVAVRASL